MTTQKNIGITLTHQNSNTHSQTGKDANYSFASSLIANYITQKQHHKGAIRLSSFHNTNVYLNGGFHSGTYAFPSETNIGKSALMQNYMEQAMQNGNYVLLVGLEMSYCEYIDRSVSSISFQANKANNINNCYRFSEIDSESDYYDPCLSDFTHVPFDKYSQYVEVFRQKYSDKLAFASSDNGKITVPEIKKAVISFKQEHPDSRLMVIIDYLQLIRSEVEDKSYQSEDRLSMISSQLQNLAITESVAILFPASVCKANNGSAKTATGIKGTVDASYSAAYVMPYEWLGVTYSKDKDTIMAEKLKCNNRGYRIMWLNPQKGRSSKNGAEGVFYKYYPAYNYIEEINYEDIKSEYGYLFGEKPSSIPSALNKAK